MASVRHTFSWLFFVFFVDFSFGSEEMERMGNFERERRGREKS